MFCGQKKAIPCNQVLPIKYQTYESKTLCPTKVYNLLKANPLIDAEVYLPQTKFASAPKFACDVFNTLLGGQLDDLICLVDGELAALAASKKQESLQSDRSLAALLSPGLFDPEIQLGKRRRGQKCISLRPSKRMKLEKM